MEPLRIVHVARTKRGRPELAIHVEKWVRLVELARPGCHQQIVHPDHISASRAAAPTVVVLHALNQRPWMVAKAAQTWPGATRVGLSYNDLWTSDRVNGPDVRSALECCHVSFGALPEDYPEIRGFRPMRTLVDAEVFRPEPVVDRDISVLIPTGFNGHAVYWGSEARRAIAGLDGVTILDGRKTQAQMADFYRRSRVVLALREYLQPSYAIVEAALCGCPLVVSDTPGLRRHLAATGGAALVPRDAAAIRAALESLVRLGDEARAQAAVRMHEALAGWTLQAQAGEMVTAILEARG